MIDERDLAAILIAYDADAPHVGPHASSHYPTFTKVTIDEWMARAHDGDCVKQAVTCRRCLAEEAIHEAVWIMARVGDILLQRRSR